MKPIAVSRLLSIILALIAFCNGTKPNREKAAETSQNEENGSGKTADDCDQRKDVLLQFLMSNQDFLQLSSGKQFETYKWLKNGSSTSSASADGAKPPFFTAQQLVDILRLLRKYSLIVAAVEAKARTTTDSERAAQQLLEQLMSEPEYLQLLPAEQWDMYKMIMKGKSSLSSSTSKTLIDSATEGGEQQQMPWFTPQQQVKSFADSSNFVQPAAEWSANAFASSNLWLKKEDPKKDTLESLFEPKNG